MRHGICIVTLNQPLVACTLLLNWESVWSFSAPLDYRTAKCTYASMILNLTNPYIRSSTWKYFLYRALSVKTCFESLFCRDFFFFFAWVFQILNFTILNCFNPLIITQLRILTVELLNMPVHLSLKIYYISVHNITFIYMSMWRRMGCITSQE
jgi:hypothetical protein